MEETKRLSLGRRLLDIDQILLDARRRWLRPPEVCEILQNYKKLPINTDPIHMPESGSLFLFNRKLQKNFRKDGYDYRKKKDGKSVNEAHEKLKCESIDVLHCYYAHVEGNRKFQRRVYSMVEEEFSHIVLVHYLELEGKRKYVSRIKKPFSKDNVNVPNSEAKTSVSSKFYSNSNSTSARTMDTGNLNNSQTLEYDDAESVGEYQASYEFNPFLDLQQPVTGSKEAGPSAAYDRGLFPCHQDELSAVSCADFNFFSQAQSINDVSDTGANNVALECAELTHWNNALASFNGNFVTINEHFHQQNNNPSVHKDLQQEFLSAGCSLSLEGMPIYSSSVTRHSGNDSLVPEILKKLDSFDRWMSKELGEVEISTLPASYEFSLETVEGDNEAGVSNVPSEARLDDNLLAPSLSHDQLFSIIDFSPNWVYVGSKTKVLIAGRFLMEKEMVQKCKWSCMFGEVEVPAEVLTDGVLCCHTPPLKVGKFPFYVTCSKGIACSEMREFECRISHIQVANFDNSNDGNIYGSLIMRLAKLLCQLSINIPKSNPSSAADDKLDWSGQIRLLMKEESDEWDQILTCVSGEHFYSENMEHLLQKLMKEKLRFWLLCKTSEGGKGPSILDDGGQGVLHFAAALGYDWAFEPTIAAGVNVNFRDVNGWTALHWAACYGRERTVASLIHFGAAPGALTDPTPQYPKGRTPADLASANGHKGIAGYLAESALTFLLSSLNLDKRQGDATGISETGVPAPDPDATPVEDEDFLELSLKSSLAAVRNATQAAAGIHQVFRIQSFQRKQLKEYDNYKLEMGHESPLSLIEESVDAAAALRIQAKFRGWKRRKEFLTIRRNVVKIQAHVRSHRARKKIIWLVGIIELIILRWRRKRNRSGLPGVKPRERTGIAPMNDGDYDFFKLGRKQAEERSQVALARVKSMVQYSEAREQYCRLRNVVTELQKAKIVREQSNNGEPTAMFDDLVDIEALLDDEALSIAGF